MKKNIIPSIKVIGIVGSILWGALGVLVGMLDHLSFLRFVAIMGCMYISLDFYSIAFPKDEERPCN